MNVREFSDRRLAREIRAARAYAGMSRAELGAAIDRNEQTIGKYERGEWTRTPSQIVLNAIAEVTGIPQSFLDAGFLRARRPEDDRPAVVAPSPPTASSELTDVLSYVAGIVSELAAREGAGEVAPPIPPRAGDSDRRAQ